MKKFFRWADGRQGSGYKIMYLWNWKFDVVLIRFPYRTHAPSHKDEVPGRNHHRINIELRKPHKGSDFSIDAKYIVFKAPRIVWFRPDLGGHALSKNLSTRKNCWLLSIGWTWGKRETR